MSAFGGKADMTFLGAYVPTKPYAYWECRENSR
jgi:hypothetical protein